MKKLFATCMLVFAGLLMYMYSYAETVSISGAVTQFSSSSGLALNDITIDVTGTKSLKVKTGRTGNYIITGLEKGGTYTLKISKPGYVFTPDTKVFKNLDESKINQNFIAERAKFSISGKVLVGGKPAKGVIVMINNRPIKYYTDEDGEYVIDNLEYNGPYEVKVVSDKYSFKPFTTEYLEKNVIHNFTKTISLTGRVTSLGEAVPGIDVDINGVIYKTDTDGYYKTDSAVSNGDYVIKIADNKFDSSPKSIPITKVTGDRDNLDFTITGQFVGKVTYNGKPLKDAIIDITDVDKQYKTDAQGMFKVSNLGLNKRYRISVSSKGYTFDPKEKIINSLSSESNYQAFKADNEKYDVTVSVTKGNKPIDNVEITLSGTTNTYRTNNNGMSIIKGLKGGDKYTISVKKNGVKFVDTKYTIENWQQDELVSFETLLDISGKVVKGVKPLKDAVVSCDGKTAQTDVNGKYTLKNFVPSKSYVVTVSSEGFTFKKPEYEISYLSEDLENVNFVAIGDEKESKQNEELEKQARIETERLAAEAKRAEEERLRAEREEAARLAEA